jgi:NADH-quinone oxidoreductase subunit G
MQDGEPALAGTARPVVALISAGTAAELGLDPAAVAEGLVDAGLEVSGATGGFVLPMAIADLPDRVVWTPTNSGASRVRAVLGAGAGDVVGLRVVPPGAEHPRADAGGAADAADLSTVPGDTRAATIGGQQ